jgi:HEAT repeat protein
MRTTLGSLALGLLLAPLAQGQSFTDSDAEVRCRALGKAGVADVAAVVSALGDPVRRVRGHASDAILRLGTPAILPLVGATRGASARRRRTAYATIGRVDPRAAAREQPRLRAAAQGGDWSAVALLNAVAKAGLADASTFGVLALSDPELLQDQPWAVPALLECLDGTAKARGAALEGLLAMGLGASGSERALEARLRAGAFNEEQRPRAAAVLATLGASEALLTLQRERPALRPALIAGALDAGPLGLTAGFELLRRGPPLDEEAWGWLLSHVSNLRVGRGYVPAGALPILRLALKAADAETREQATWVLPEIGPAGQADLLLPLRDPAPNVRIAAARAASEDSFLVVTGPRAEAIQARLCDLLLNDPEVEVRGAVGQTLATRGRPSPGLREALVRALSDPSEEVQAFATQGLGRFDFSAREVRKVLRDLATSTARSWDVRAAAVGALAEQGALRDIERLLLATEPDDLEILANGLHDRSYSRNPGDAPLGREAFLALLRAPAPTAQAAGAEFLERVGPRDPKLLATLRPLLRKLRSPDAQAYLLEGIVGSLGPEDFRHWLIPKGKRSTRSDSEHRRIGHAWGNSEPPDSLVAALSRPQASRLDFFYLTTNLSPRHAGLLPTFRQRLLDPKSNVTREVLRGLQALGPAGAPALPELLELLPPRSPYASREVLKALAEIGPPAAPALPALLPLLRSAPDHDDYVVVDTFKALAALGPAAGPALSDMRAALGEAESIVPEATLEPFARALVACAEAGDTRELQPSLQALVAAVDTTSAFWPEDALEALLAIGPHAKPAAATLLDLALDPHAPMDERSLAARALNSVDPTRTPELTASLVQSLRAREKEERYSAAKLLAFRGSKLSAVASVALRALREGLDHYQDQEWVEVLRASGPQGIACLADLVESGTRAHQRLAAAESLNQLQAGEFTPLVRASLAKGLESPSRDLRVTCAAALLRGAQLSTPRPEDAVALTRSVGVLLREGEPELAPGLLEAVGSAGVGALPDLVRALDDRQRRPAALRGIAALGSAALPAAPRLRAMVREAAPGCVYAACALLDLGPDDELLGREALRSWVPDLPRGELAYPALELGRKRGAHYGARDRALALRALERSIRYEGMLARGRRQALLACLALGERDFVAGIRDDPRSSRDLRRMAQGVLPPASPPDKE